MPKRNYMLYRLSACGNSAAGSSFILYTFGTLADAAQFKSHRFLFWIITPRFAAKELKKLAIDAIS